VQFGIDISESGEWVIVAARGDLDLATAPRAASALAQLPPGARRVVVDLSRVDLLDATGFGVLVGLRSRLAQSGGTLVLSCPSPLLDRLDGTGLAATFAVVDSVAAAVGCQPLEGTP
jgi:anti-sigma B factor antagonist